MNLHGSIAMNSLPSTVIGMSTMGKRLQEAIDRRGMSPAGVITAAKLAKGTVYNILNDTTRPEKVWADTLYKLCGLLNIAPTWLLYGVGQMDGRTASSDADYTPVTGYAQAAGLGTGMEAQEYAETHTLKFKASSLRRKGLQARNLAVYYGKGDSMEPTIKDGDAIMFDTSDTRVVDGALYLVQLHGTANAEYYVKRALVLDGVIYFESDNPAGDHSWKRPKRMDSVKSPITVMGRVRWIAGWTD